MPGTKIRAFRDRERFGIDPRHGTVPLDRLLSDAYVDEMAASIDQLRRGPADRPGTTGPPLTPRPSAGGATQDQAIATLLTPHAATIQALAAGEALRAFGQKTGGKLPTTIAGLPPELGPLMSTLLKSAPAPQTQPQPPR